ncbi:hypothetical protein H2203_007682 [Taxawa tesnikishii (nom. ined.)]|nr:hypothetical protein H2203_007682 [Dothideales sp. JES 119]
MSTAPRSDPYAALGVSKDATAAQIKTAYRKLALKWHPDKVTDESQKANAADEFHKIQQAYEAVGDEEKRAKYDAQQKLAELRRDVMERQGARGPTVEVKTAAYEVPTSSPRGAAFTSRGPDRYEERRPSKQYDSDSYFDSRASARKYDDYERVSKRLSPRDERERVKVSAKEDKESERYSRSDRRRARDRDERRERESKYRTVEDDSEDEYVDRLRYESRRRAEEEERARERRERERYPDERARKTYDTQAEAMDYISRSARGRDLDARPTASRTSSAREPYYEIRQSSDRPPVMVRRSSAKPSKTRESESPRRSSARETRDRDRDRRTSVPEIVEYPSDRERRPPSMPHSTSSPAAIKIPRDVRESRRSATLPMDTPGIRRSETMPVQSLSRNRRDTAPLKSSGLRKTEINEGLPTPSTTPEYTGPSSPYTSTKYRYPVAEDEFEYSNGHRTVVREPSPIKSRSASSRYEVPPRPQPRNCTHVRHPSPTSYSRPSPVTRSSSERVPQFGEYTPNGGGISSGRGGERERYRVPDDNVKYSPQYGRDDIRMQSGYSSKRDSPPRPSLSRSNTGYGYA